MRLFLLGLVFLTAQTTLLRAQDTTPLDWTTSILQKLPGEAYVRVAAETASVDVKIEALPESLIVDPPAYVLESDPDWERFFVEGGANRITRVLVDEWPAPVVYGLMLARGGLFLDGAGNDTTAAIAAFRLRHPSIAEGDHVPLINADYSFHRSLSGRGGNDRVVIVFGANGTSSINVSRAFADDALLHDAMTGQTAFVSFGMASFDAHPSGVILIEELR